MLWGNLGVPWGQGFPRWLREHWLIFLPQLSWCWAWRQRAALSVLMATSRAFSPLPPSLTPSQPSYSELRLYHTERRITAGMYWPPGDAFSFLENFDSLCIITLPNGTTASVLGSLVHMQIVFTIPGCLTTLFSSPIMLSSTLIYLLASTVIALDLIITSNCSPYHPPAHHLCLPVSLTSRIQAPIVGYLQSSHLWHISYIPWCPNFSWSLLQLSTRLTVTAFKTLLKYPLS